MTDLCLQPVYVRLVKSKTNYPNLQKQHYNTADLLVHDLTLFFGFPLFYLLIRTPSKANKLCHYSELALRVTRVRTFVSVLRFPIIIHFLFSNTRTLLTYLPLEIMAVEGAIASTLTVPLLSFQLIAKCYIARGAVYSCSLFTVYTISSSPRAVRSDLSRPIYHSWGRIISVTVRIRSPPLRASASPTPNNDS